MVDKKEKGEEAKRSSSSSLPARQNESTQEAIGGDSSVTLPTSAPPSPSVPTTSPPANPVTVRKESRKRKRTETRQGSGSEPQQAAQDVLCPPTSAPPSPSIPTTSPPANPVTVRKESRRRKRTETGQGSGSGKGSGSEPQQAAQGEDVLCPICFTSFQSAQAMRGHLHTHDKEERKPHFGSPKSKVMKQQEMIAAMNLTSMKAADNFWPINKQISAAEREKFFLSSPQRIRNPHLNIDCNKTPPGSPSSSPLPPSPPGEHPGFPFNLNRSPPPSPGAAGQAPVV